MKKPQKYYTFSQAFKRGQGWQGKPTCQDENLASSPWNKLEKKTLHHLIAELKAETWFNTVVRFNCINLSHPQAKRGWGARAFRWQRQQRSRSCQSVGGTLQTPTVGSQAPAQARTHHRAARMFSRNTKKYWTGLAITGTHGECNGFSSIIYKAALVYNLWSSYKLQFLGAINILDEHYCTLL